MKLFNLYSDWKEYENENFGETGNDLKKTEPDKIKPKVAAENLGKLVNLNHTSKLPKGKTTYFSE